MSKIRDLKRKFRMWVVMRKVDKLANTAINGAFDVCQVYIAKTVAETIATIEGMDNKLLK